LVQQVNPPALLFTEPILLDGTWEDVLQVVKRSGATTPVIVVSDRVDKKLAVEVIEGGAFDYLVNPVTILELVHVVRCALWHSRPDRYAVAQASGG
jgi:DNA-binding response OmpR family regulator